ncbi:MAG: right-handed parallel beta-helix repeat-containing protein [Candidatus Latescibacteria bacterium]|nr:right-handed parallel beta-helix repeat-containing protein [Candidatus Latescibacterota bacterium]
MLDTHTRYVSLNGSDQGTGTKEAPFRTISTALANARPGTTIIVEPGLHHERVQIPSSGSPGDPIVLEGARGPGGEWQTVIGGAVPLECDWETAPEIGEGVFKTTGMPFEPHFLTVEGNQIPRIWHTQMDDGTGFEKLAYPPSHRVRTQYTEAMVDYWDTVEAMFGLKGDTTYIRFRNGDDPNDKQLCAGPQGGVINIENQSHIALRNLLVRGGQNCVLVSGEGARHNVVEDCRLVGGDKRVYITAGASHNHIRNNEITADFYAQRYQTGAWGGPKGDASPYELRVKEHFYLEYKHFFGPHATSDYGVRVELGHDNHVYGNHIYRGGQGVQVTSSSDSSVYDNTVHNFSSIGLICTMNRVKNIRFHNNLVYDCNINLRIHHVNEPNQDDDRSLYVYRNRFYQNPGTGTHIFMHYWDGNDAEDYRHAGVFIYHNSLSGGNRGISMNAFAGNCGGLPKGIIVNNILSAKVGFNASSSFFSQEGMYALFDYNWLGAETGQATVQAPWYGLHNVYEPGRTVWDVAEIPDFVLPEGSAALSAGLDLSKPFPVDGRQAGPLAGMEPGYFTGSAPDLGAVQSGSD